MLHDKAVASAVSSKPLGSADVPKTKAPPKASQVKGVPTTVNKH